MEITIQSLLLDSITALWITGLSVVLLIGVPNKILFYPKLLTCSDRIIESLAKSVLLLVTGVLVLVALSLFNWFTLVLWYFSGMFIFRLMHDYQKTLQKVQILWHGSLYFLFDLLDQQISWLSVLKKLRSHRISWQKRVFQSENCNQKLRSELLPTLVTLTIILSFTLFLRYEYPLLGMRFSHSDAYQTLLTTRQILAGQAFASHAPPVFVSLAAVLTLLGSIDPMQTVRFLSPLLGVALVVSVGYGVYALMRSGVAALVSMLSLGAYWFTWTWDIPEHLPAWLQQHLEILITQLNADLIRQWTATDPEIGAIFLILAITQIDRGLHQRHRSAWLSASCCSAIVALTSPPLLLLAALSILGLIISQRWALGMVAIGWLGLGLLAPLLNSYPLLQPFLITLPVALSLFCGYFFALLNRPFQFIFGDLTPSLGLILIFAISINFLLPFSPNITYLEYDIAARETLALNARFPAKQWMLIAPTEQFSETYGEAWYGDLAEFVDTYADQVQQPDFQFPFSIPDLFVFVEKQPFKTFSVEPSNIFSESAFDPVYRNYRTIAGRSSLQFDAMKLCEAYRKIHSDSLIEYENSTLKVYHFHLHEETSAD